MEHTVIPKKAFVYDRPNSSNYYMRYKLADGEWERVSTKTSDIKEAKEAALNAYQQEQLKKQGGIPSSKKTINHFADQYITKLQSSIDVGKQKGTFAGYIRVTEKYIKPLIGHVKIGSVDDNTIKHFDEQRDEMFGGKISKSAINTHNVVLRAILQLAVDGRYIKKSDIPRLTVKGKGDAPESRPPFDEDDLAIMRENWDEWIGQVNSPAQYNRKLLQQYVEFIAATGVRPGQEALGVKWKHISHHTVQPLSKIPQIDMKLMMEEIYEELRTGKTVNSQKGVEPYICIKITEGKIHNRSGQKPQRMVIARKEIERVLFNIKQITRYTADDDYLFCSATGGYLDSELAPLFTKFLTFCGILEAADGRRRSLYSLRHYYTNTMIKKNTIPLIVIAQNMGTSVEMLEKYYAENLVKDFAREFVG